MDYDYIYNSLEKMTRKYEDDRVRGRIKRLRKEDWDNLTKEEENKIIDLCDENNIFIADIGNNLLEFRHYNLDYKEINNFEIEL